VTYKDWDPRPLNPRKPKGNRVKATIMKKKILIAEDDKPLRNLLKLSFDSEYEVWEAKDGEEALGLCQSVKPDMILVDGMIPKVDGKGVCSQIRSSYEFGDPKIIITTGTVLDTEETWRKAYQIDGYFEKPYEIAELKEKIKELFGEN